MLKSESASDGRWMLEEENLVAAMESALEADETGFVEANLEVLQDLIDRLQREVFVLSRLQYRACIVRDDHRSKTA